MMLSYCLLPLLTLTAPACRGEQPADREMAQAEVACSHAELMKEFLRIQKDMTRLVQALQADPRQMDRARRLQSVIDRIEAARCEKVFESVRQLLARPMAFRSLIELERLHDLNDDLRDELRGLLALLPPRTGDIAQRLSDIVAAKTSECERYARLKDDLIGFQFLITPIKP